MRERESEKESGRVNESEREWGREWESERDREWVRETIKNRSLVSNEQFPTALKSEKHFSLKRLLINFCFDEYNEFFNSKYLFSNETDY